MAGATSADGEHQTHFSPFSFFSRRHPITVRYTLHVPSGVHVAVETVNGKIAAQDIAGDVKASTVNGDVTVSTTKGTVNAETVNGSIVASMALLPDSGNVHLETVNGSITSLIPEGIGGSIVLDNTNGSITANYPNAVPDKEDKHHMRIKLDEGKRRVTPRDRERIGEPVALCEGAGGVAAELTLAVALVRVPHPGDDDAEVAAHALEVAPRLESFVSYLHPLHAREIEVLPPVLDAALREALHLKGFEELGAIRLSENRVRLDHAHSAGRVDDAKNPPLLECLQNDGARHSILVKDTP